MDEDANEVNVRLNVELLKEVHCFKFMASNVKNSGHTYGYGGDIYSEKRVYSFGCSGECNELRTLGLKGRGSCPNYVLRG